MVRIHQVDCAEKPPAEDVDKALDLLCQAGAGGNLTSDAQMAALSLRHRAIVHTADTDFASFPEVSWKNPLLE
jgi:uncharacterized protein